MAHQGGDDATLEISPQTGIRPPAGASDEIPGNREFRPGDNTASVNREFKANEEDSSSKPRPHTSSCLGIDVEYWKYCYKGAEEHGLEVTKIASNSPAEQAGLKAGNNGVGKALEFLDVIRFADMFLNHKLEQLNDNHTGDLIVAVDDQRVRTKADLDDAIAKARPGDTLYLTVIRPMPDGDHKTIKIAVNVGTWQDANSGTCNEFVESSQAKPGS